MKIFLVYVVDMFDDYVPMVFKVDCFNLAPFGREAQLIFNEDPLNQHEKAVAFCKGAAAAGAKVMTAACYRPHNVAQEQWSENFEFLPLSWHENCQVILKLNTNQNAGDGFSCQCPV